MNEPRGCVCYTHGMRWWRRCALSRVVVFAILLWTAADLSNATICALENEGTSSPTIATPFTLDGTVLHGEWGPSAPPAQAPHVDDCFCCSHCTEVAGLVASHAAIVAVRPTSPVVVSAPRIFASALYHPPQLSLQ